MWFLPSIALADEPVAPDDDETIVVEDHPSAASARADLDAALRADGFLPGLDIGGRTIYQHPQRWKGRVTVFDDGFMSAHAPWLVPLWIRPVPGNPPRIEVYGYWSTPQEAREVEDLAIGRYTPLVDRWRDAMSAEALAQRLEAIDDQLDEVWSAHPDATGRSAIVAVWRNTTDTDAGQAVRDRVERFVRREHIAFSTAEIDAADRDPRGFDDRFLD
jgi:hypothetical protein